MNGYMVWLRYAFEDFPISLHKSLSEAHAAAMACDVSPPKIFKSDASEAVSVCIVRFDKGRPVNWHFVRDFEETAG